MQPELTLELDSESHAKVVQEEIMDLIRSSYISLSNDRGTPIASLPEELLPPILVEVIKLEVVHLEFSQKWRATWRRRVELTTVCKEWRRIALAYPVFWSGFWLRPRLQGLGQMLPRWKNYPRKIAVDSEDFSAPIAEWSDCANLHTTELVGELRVVGPVGSAGDMDTFWNILSPFERAPETAPFHGAGSTDSRTTFPNLRALCLLELSPGPPSRILDVLLSSHHLQQVTIQNLIPPDYALAFTWADPPLRSCYLAMGLPFSVELNDATPLLLLLSRILTLPIHTLFDLTLYAKYFPINTRTELLVTELAQRLGSHSNIIASRWDHLVLRLIWFGSQPESMIMRATFREPDENGGACWDLHLPDHPRGWSLLRCLDAPTITKLSLTWPDLFLPFHPETTWRSLFSRHPNIHSLEIEGIEKMETILTVLTPSVGGPETSYPCLLPKLQRITLFCDRQNYADSRDVAKLIFDRVGTLAISRSQHGTPISEVKFFDCEDVETALLNLRERLLDVTEVVDGGNTGLNPPISVSDGWI